MHIHGMHNGYNSGVMSNATPNFSPNNLHNAQLARGNQQQHNEHWQEQLRLYKQSREVHHASTTLKVTNHAARQPNKVKQYDTPDPDTSAVDEYDDSGRPSNQPVEISRQEWNGLDMGGHGIVKMSEGVFCYKFLHEIYLNSNRLTLLPMEIGTLRQLRFLDLSHNQLTELPPELGMCVFLETLILFDNQLRTLPNELGSLSQLDMLGIEGNPMDENMRQCLIEKGTRELIMQLRENGPSKFSDPTTSLIILTRLPVPLPPPPRQMIDIAGATDDSESTIRVFTYNILCSKYATKELYGYTPSNALEWEYRREEVLQEIQSAAADIVCLQEVDTESFREYFSMKLAYSGYKGVFWPKGRAKTMSEEKQKVVDGCATFYDSKKFVLLDKQLVDFANIAINRSDMKNQSDIFNRVMPRDHIAIVTFFENRMDGSRLIVVNVHTFANPAYADVKTIQTAILMEYLAKLSEKYARWPACKDKTRYKLSSDESPQDPPEEEEEPQPSMVYSSGTALPLFVVGDFNSEKGSGVHTLLSTGSIPGAHPDLEGFSYGNFTREGIVHPFSLRSAYAGLEGTVDELGWTNYTPGFTGVLDYIWYGSNCFDVKSVLGGWDKEYLTRVPGFPHWHFPSDHLSLLAEFTIRKAGRKPSAVRSRDRRSDEKSDAS